MRTEGLLDFVTPPPSTTQGTRTQGIAASVAICGVPRRYCCNACPEHIENIVSLLALPNAPMFFTFPDDARWNAERQAVEFCVEIGNTTASCGYPGACFSACCRRRPPPNAALKHTICSGHALRGVAEQKLRWRQVTEDGNVEITGRDLREGSRMEFRNALLR